YIVPGKWHHRGKMILADIDDTLGSYIRGQFLVCLILAGMATVGFWIFQVPYFVLLGIIIGVTDIIPYFGPIIGALPVALVSLSVSWKTFLIVISFIVLLQFIESNLLSPLIFGKSLHMHPITIILVIF